MSLQQSVHRDLAFKAVCVLGAVLEVNLGFFLAFSLYVFDDLCQAGAEILVICSPLLIMFGIMGLVGILKVSLILFKTKMQETIPLLEIYSLFSLFEISVAFVAIMCKYYVSISFPPYRVEYPPLFLMLVGWSMKVNFHQLLF